MITSSDKEAPFPFNLINIDLLGLVQPSSIGGRKYVLGEMDDFPAKLDIFL